MKLEFSKTIENVKSTYVFAKEALLKFLFSPNQHVPTTPTNKAKVASLV
jgi:cytochrome c2